MQGTLQPEVVSIQWAFAVATLAPLLLPLRAMKATCSQDPAAPSEHSNDPWKGPAWWLVKVPREKAAFLPGEAAAHPGPVRNAAGWPDAYVVMVQVVVSAPR